MIFHSGLRVQLRRTCQGRPAAGRRPGSEAQAVTSLSVWPVARGARPGSQCTVGATRGGWARPATEPEEPESSRGVCVPRSADVTSLPRPGVRYHVNLNAQAGDGAALPPVRATVTVKPAGDSVEIGVGAVRRPAAAGGAGQPRRTAGGPLEGGDGLLALAVCQVVPRAGIVPPTQRTSTARRRGAQSVRCQGPVDRFPGHGP